MQEIPITPTRSSFIQEVALDGRTYRMLFRWSAREGCWYMTLRDSSDVDILSGLKLTVGAALLRFSVDADRRPPGELFLVDPTDRVATPGRDELGTAATLVYITAAEAVAL